MKPGPNEQNGAVSATDNALWRKTGGTKITLQALKQEFPPEFRHPFKQKMYERAAAEINHGTDEVSILRVMYQNPDRFHYRPAEVVNVPYFYRYDDLGQEGKTVWYVNFADPILFVAYDSGLFAQDEIQTLEHPLLGGIAEFLNKKRLSGLPAMTVEHEDPSPILIRNIPYQIRINTMPADKSGETVSIYGNKFAYAPEELLERAITVLDDDSRRSNILAMAALPPSRGAYRPDQIQYLIKAVFCAFAAARADSSGTTVIHTGRWGAGAFGGSEELVLLIQILGARAAGIEKLIFHAVSGPKLENAMKYAEDAAGNDLDTLEKLSAFILDRHYQWGISDGN
jgi:hypothetical protein